MKRLAVARWLNDAGRKLGVWVAPELPEVDALMMAVEAQELAEGRRNDEAVDEAVRRFVTGSRNG